LLRPGYNMNLPDPTWQVPQPQGQLLQGQSDEDGHGTAMAGCVMGQYAGVDKNAAVVSIKLFTNTNNDNSEANSWGISKAFTTILIDMLANNVPEGVVSMSFGCLQSSFVPLGSGQTPAQADPFPRLLSLVHGGLVAVTSSGNEAIRGNFLTDETPRCHGGPLPDNNQMIVVGAADYNGRRAAFSTYLNPVGENILTVYGPGVEVISADYLVDDAWSITSGSSHATAQVAAIVAGYLKNVPGVNVNNVKQYLIDQSVMLKGLNFAVDDPRFPPHPRVGVASQIACTPIDTNNVPTATQPPTFPTAANFFADAVFSSAVTVGVLVRYTKTMVFPDIPC
jgi:Subtilase family